MRNKEIEKYLPKNKFDFNSVEYLKKFPSRDLVPYLGDLLVWLQDTHWPITEVIIEILQSFQDELIPHFEDIFKTDDDIWKLNSLFYINRYLKKSSIKKMKYILYRIANSPTKGEKEEEVDIKARDILDKIS